MIHLTNDYYLNADPHGLALIEKKYPKDKEGNEKEPEFENVAFASQLKDIIKFLNNLLVRNGVYYDWNETKIIESYLALNKKVDEITTKEFDYPFVLMRDKLKQK